jgi:hypothetical protein
MVCMLVYMCVCMYACVHGVCMHVSMVYVCMYPWCTYVCMCPWRPWCVCWCTCVYVCMHVCMCMYKFMHAYMMWVAEMFLWTIQSTYIHACMDACTYLHTCTHAAYICMHGCMYILTYMHACMHGMASGNDGMDHTEYIYTCMHECMYILTCMHACVWLAEMMVWIMQSTYTHVQMYMHACMHAYNTWSVLLDSDPWLRDFWSMCIHMHRCMGAWHGTWHMDTTELIRIYSAQLGWFKANLVLRRRVKRDVGVPARMTNIVMVTRCTYPSMVCVCVCVFKPIRLPFRKTHTYTHTC